MKVKATTIDEYLAAASADKRSALEKLRKLIRAAVPTAEECISYGLPAFRLGGRTLVGFGAAANHCSFFPMTGHTVNDFKDELHAFKTTKGSIHFTPKKPLPAALVRKMIKVRIAENSKKGNKPQIRTNSTRGSGASRGRKSASAESQSNPEVASFLHALDHPLKHDIEAVRQIILGVSPEIGEGIKWNSVSFRTTDYFATVNCRSKDRVQLVFHCGAKVKDNSTSGMAIADPAGLIKWLAKERCLVTLGKGKEIAGNRKAFEAIVREWIRRT